MYRLRNTETNDIVKTWGGVPRRAVDVPGLGRVHCISEGWTGGGYVFEHVEDPPAPPPPPPTVEQVAAERDRRLAMGFDYDFGDQRGVHRIGTTPADMVGWDEVSKYAGALIDIGDTTTTIAILTDTGPCLVTAPEWRAIEIAAAGFRQPLWAASFALQAQNPIPGDYNDDTHWP